jgi:tRNA threonylcarbamoyl adenosine modification protein YeaZ
MRILAIDTATEACSAALWNDGTLCAHFEICPREHTQRILPLVQDVLTESNTSLTELDALAFGRGPGSFTGVRIGIGIAQGLALGAELPMIGVSTLATMAQGAWRKTGATRVLAAIDARMGEVYWAEYSAMSRASGTAKRRKRCSNRTRFANGCTAFRRVGHRRHRLAGVAGSGERDYADLNDGEMSCRRRKICCRWPVTCWRRGKPWPWNSGAGLFAKRRGVEETSGPRVNLSNKRLRKGVASWRVKKAVRGY